MIELRLDDPHFAENALAAMSLKKMGFRDDELELLYQKQLEEDRNEQNSWKKLPTNKANGNQKSFGHLKGAKITAR